MLATINRPIEIDFKYLRVQVPNEYDESAFSDEGYKMFCKTLTEDKEQWCPLIEIETGKIVNWAEGLTCQIFFKPVDMGVYWFMDENNVTFLKHEGYVPYFLGIDDKSWGDYISLTVGKDGYIIDWNPYNVVEYIENYEND